MYESLLCLDGRLVIHVFTWSWIKVLRFQLVIHMIELKLLIYELSPSTQACTYSCTYDVHISQCIVHQELKLSFAIHCNYISVFDSQSMYICLDINMFMIPN
jgi:hypothetical protein